MLAQSNKRKPLACMTNAPKKLLNQTNVLKLCRVDLSHLMPIGIVDEHKTEVNTKTDILLQNKHPLLAMCSTHTPDLTTIRQRS